MKAFIRRMIVRAAPTCTLWTQQVHEDCWRFRFYPRWKITGMEYLEVK